MLDYTYFKENYKMIAMDLSKQQSLDADTKAIQQINFTANLDKARNTRIFFLKKKLGNTKSKKSKAFIHILIFSF